MTSAAKRLVCFLPSSSKSPRGPFCIVNRPNSTGLYNSSLPARGGLRVLLLVCRRGDGEGGKEERLIAGAARVRRGEPFHSFVCLTAHARSMEFALTLTRVTGPGNGFEFGASFM